MPEFEDFPDTQPEAEVPDTQAEVHEGEEADGEVEGEENKEEMFWAWGVDGVVNYLGEDGADDFAGDDAEDFIISDDEAELDPELAVAAAPGSEVEQVDESQAIVAEPAIVDESQAMVDPDPIIEIDGSEVPLKDDPASSNREVARPLARLRKASSSIDVERMDLRGCRDEVASDASSSVPTPSPAEMIVGNKALTKEEKFAKLKSLLAKLKALEAKADDSAKEVGTVATEVRESLSWISSVWSLKGSTWSGWFWLMFPFHDFLTTSRS